MFWRWSCWQERPQARAPRASYRARDPEAVQFRDRHSSRLGMARWTFPSTKFVGEREGENDNWPRCHSNDFFGMSLFGLRLFSRDAIGRVQGETMSYKNRNNRSLNHG